MSERMEKLLERVYDEWRFTDEAVDMGYGGRVARAVAKRCAEIADEQMHLLDETDRTELEKVARYSNATVKIIVDHIRREFGVEP